MRASFLRRAAEAVFGAEEIARKISQGDARYYIGNLRDGDQVPQATRTAIAYVLKENLLRPFPDNSIRPAERMRRLDALTLLARWIEARKPNLLQSGILAPPEAAENATLAVRWNNRTSRIPLARSVRLFRIDGARSIPAQTLNLIGGEKLRYHIDSNGAVDFMEVELNPGGRVSDRFAPQASWKARMTRRDASEKLRPLAGNVGEVLDLVPEKLGDSGRVVQMRIEGTRGATIVNGYRVRNALGLRDTLFKISRSRDSDGLVKEFLFEGRGWGHGVGLCQTGAAGMARAGRTFQEILRAYYPGVDIRPAY
jgi:stage II sporulation protein D